MHPASWKRIVGAVVLFACASSFATARVAAPAPVPVVAELFTSEGCSSCPPADALLMRLLAEQPVEGVEVIGVSEHVDYWNGLGWRDPFSSSRFSERQREYARARSWSSIYTPQMVVDGRLQALGSNPTGVRQALLEAAKAPHASVAVSATRSEDGRFASVRISVRDLPDGARSGGIRLVLAIVQDGLATDVTRGENARKYLRHDAVARVLDSVAVLDHDAVDGELATELALDSEWARGHLRLVAFLQDDVTRHIVGAGSSDLD